MSSSDKTPAIGRRRTNSTLAGTPRASQSRQHPKLASTIPTEQAEPKSTHVADPFLHPFLAPALDPAEYLNTVLPPLQTTFSTSARSSNNSSASATDAVPLADLSSRAQTQLSQLNAHTTRLTNTLTQLTDEILRSGSRLAYEVELLRGETLSLSEALTEGLHDDIVRFVPEGIQEQKETKGSGAVQGLQRRQSVLASPSTLNGNSTAAPSTENNTSTKPSVDPPYIRQLQTLTLVRSRLDSVVKTFGDAMEFVFPPSELSVSSSFLSVSAPEPGAEAHSTEEKGQQTLKKLKDEISELLLKSDDPIVGIEGAAHRIEELKELTTVWKGTAEEKGRAKFIDSLAKTVEDRHKELVREMEQSVRSKDSRIDTDRRTPNAPDGGGTDNKPLSGYGLMSQLQRLRAGL